MNAMEPLSAALERYKVAVAALRHGDAVPYIDCWARTDEVTLYETWGPAEKGWEAIASALTEAGSQFTGGTVRVELTQIIESGDLACTVGLERDRGGAGRGPRRETVLRVTQVYRRADGQWRVIHRHADRLPEDRRKAGW
jgi:ketosteroid isomerase-like protein